MEKDKSKDKKSEISRKKSPYDEVLNQMTYGVTSNIESVITDTLLNKFDEITNLYQRKKNSLELVTKTGEQSGFGVKQDEYTDISDFINRKDSETLMTMESELRKLQDKSNRFYSLIRDYEMMPMLVPQINRVLQFFINETISPDLQNDYTFAMNYTGNDKTVNEKLKNVRKELKLDNMLRSVYKDRYSYGKLFYRVLDYSETFNSIYNAMKGRNILNETVSFGDINSKVDVLMGEFANHHHQITNLNESVVLTDGSTMKFELSELGIDINFNPLSESVNAFKDMIMSESINSLSLASINESLSKSPEMILNESAAMSSQSNDEKFKRVLENYKTKDLNRCSVEKLDPARVFKVKASGRVIGYFYIADKDKLTNSDSIRDRLLKTKSKNVVNDYDIARRKAVDTIANEIISKTKGTLNLSSMEEADLFHDYLLNSEIYKGNKNVKFYHKDDIFDLSREEDSIYINAVYFVKLYASLMGNNIMTKILRGRGRQFHTVNVGVSPDATKYVNAAIVSLSAPESRLAGFNGPFESVLNPLYGASDIVMPSEDATEAFIRSDIIEGQNIDMDTDILKLLLNSIINSFGVDSAIVDVVNGNVDFAKTIAMISSQVSTLVKNEQLDLIDEWTRMIYRILVIEYPELKTEIENNNIKIKFFKPNSVVLALSQDELNNAKSYAETLADIHPHINALELDDPYRILFIYETVKQYVSCPWDVIDETWADVINNKYPAIMAEKKIYDAVKEATTNKKDEVVEEDDDM